MIEFRALGNAQIVTDIAVLTPAQPVVFAAAIYLILHREKPTPRSALVELIWPEIDSVSGAHRLRQTLLQLKKLGLKIRASRDSVILDESVTSDASPAGIESVIDDDRQSVAFLPGYNPQFSTSFANWLDTVRNEFQAATVEALVHGVQRARSQGNWTRVDRLARRCLTLDPFNEEAVLAQAEAAAMRGSKSQALSILDQYLADLGESPHDLKVPATLLRRRVAERMPERPVLSNSDPPFVGREAEMATLTIAFENARAGNGSAVFVEGDPGVGKTRLSAEFARFAELRGGRVQRATCSRADVDRPLSLFVDIVPELRELPGALGCAPETFTLLKRLTEFEQRQSDVIRPLDTEQLFDRIRAALFDLLESIAEERCVAIVIDDVQWLDKASAALLARMVFWCRTKRILFVLNARPGRHLVLDYCDTVELNSIKLGPLSANDAVALLKSLPLTSSTDSFLAWCLSVAEGNPFFLQELAHHWIETGQMSGTPRSISRTLEERLSRVTPEALQILQTAALLNDFATLGRIAKVLGYAPHRFLFAVEELSKAAMLQCEIEQGDVVSERLRPKHDFLASVALERLSSIARSFLHRRCAEILEADLGRPTVSATLLWACATHRHHSGDREKALLLRISCAEHLIAMGLARDACDTYHQTLNYCSNDADRLKVLPLLASAFELDGRWNGSIETLRECMRLEQTTSSSDSQHNDYELQMLEARHRSTLDFASLLEDTLTCVNASKAQPKHKIGAAVIAMKVAVDFGRLDLLDTIYHEIEPHFGNSEVSELHCIEAKTIYRTMRGPHTVDAEELNRFVELARALGGELGYSRALRTATNACRLSGRYEEGLEFASRALEHADANRFYSKRREILIWTIALHMSAGEFGKARKILTAIVTDAFPSDSAWARNEIFVLDARIAIEEGDFERAATLFQQAQPVAPTYSLARRCYCTALEVQIRVSQGADSLKLEPLVSDLESFNSALRLCMGRDFESYSLFVGLRHLGEERRARALLEDYVKERRDKWPVSARIRAVLDETVSGGILPQAESDQETAARKTVPLSGVL